MLSHAPVPLADDLDDLLALEARVGGVSFSRGSDDLVTVVRETDEIEIDIRLLPATSLDSRADDRHSVLAVRWVEPEEPTLEALDRFNATASISVGTSRRYDDLYAKTGKGFFRAQVLATGLEPEQFLKALARDAGLRESIDSSTPTSLDEVRMKLDASPVLTKEESLLYALFGKPPSEAAGEHYRRDGDVLRGASSVGESSGGAGPVDVTIRVCDLGLVHVRHERPLPAETTLRTLDEIRWERSRDETLVGYHRVFLVDPATVALEVSASFAELGTRWFEEKVRRLEIAVSSYLTRQ